MQKVIQSVLDNFSCPQEIKDIIEKIQKCESIDVERVRFVVANLIQKKVDLNSIVAYLVSESSYENLSELDEDIVFISSTLKNQYKIFDTAENESEQISKMFIALSADVRVIIIRLYIMLYNINQFKLPLSKNQHSQLLAVREIFAPLAERLGLNSVKSGLEDCCLKFLNPKVYNELEQSVFLHKEKNQQQIDIITEKLQTILKELNYKDAVIMSRQKHFSSIYKKMKFHKDSLASIYDIIALRVVVQTVEQCYAVLGKIHGLYKPMEGRFKDYIASPKPNGYQSLHTTIIADNQRPLEIQIRTDEMHKLSEYGVFSHWMYKEKRTKMTQMDKRISWLREIMEYGKNQSSDEFVETLKTNLCEGKIYVQTPKGKIIELIDGATALDFAYAIHSGVGNMCVGVKINGNIKPISTKLKTSDVVEVLTSQNSKGPSKDWIKFVKTSSAKSKINSFFKNENKDENIKIGYSMLEQAVKNKGYNVSKVMSDKYLNVDLYKNVYKEVDDILADVGHGSLSAITVCNKLIALYDHDANNDVEIPLEEVLKPIENTLQLKRNKDGILVDGDSGMLIRYAGCCSPVYGEEITGYISRGRGVTIHKHDCVNLKYLEKERLIKAVWDENSTNRVSSIVIKIIADNIDNFIMKLTQNLMVEKIKILGLEGKLNSLGKISSVIKVEVKSQSDISRTLNVIKNIKGVENVFRVNN